MAVAMGLHCYYNGFSVTIRRFTITGTVRELYLKIISDEKLIIVILVNPLGSGRNGISHDIFSNKTYYVLNLHIFRTTENHFNIFMSQISAYVSTCISHF